jgi:hypothetical protein
VSSARHVCNEADIVSKAQASKSDGMAPFLELIALGLVLLAAATAWLTSVLIRFVHPD